MKALRGVCRLLVGFLCAAGLIGCAEKLPDRLGESYQSRTHQAWSIMIPGEIDRVDDTLVLFNGYYDMLTGELVRGYCEDPECDGDCYLESGYCTMHSLVGDRVYFMVFAPREDTVYYCRRELASGEISVLFTLPEEEQGAFDTACVDGEYYYYPRMMLREGGNPDNLNDYESYICRYDMERDVHETLYQCRGEMEVLYYVIDGVLYTSYNGGFWRTELATMEQTLLVDHDALGYRSGFVAVRYLDGYFYDLAVLPEGGRQLVRFDAVSGEQNVLLDEQVDSYALTNQGIYFFPQVPMRPIGKPISGEGEDAEYEYIGGSTIYACDHDGSNVRPIWTDESGLIDLNNVAYTVFDNVYYGDIRIFDVEANAFGEHFFAEIHFETGEVIPAIEVE